MNRQQFLIDKLTVAIPMLQRVVVTSKQQQADASAALTAAQDMVDALKNGAPPVVRTGATPSLELAILRSGHTTSEVAFLTSISRERLGNLIAGEKPTQGERESLRAVLADWQSE